MLGSYSRGCQGCRGCRGCQGRRGQAWPSSQSKSGKPDKVRDCQDSTGSSAGPPGMGTASCTPQWSTQRCMHCMRCMRCLRCTRCTRCLRCTYGGRLMWPSHRCTRYLAEPYHRWLDPVLARGLGLGRHQSPRRLNVRCPQPGDIDILVWDLSRPSRQVSKVGFGHLSLAGEGRDCPARNKGLSPHREACVPKGRARLGRVGQLHQDGCDTWSCASNEMSGLHFPCCIQTCCFSEFKQTSLNSAG